MRNGRWMIYEVISGKSIKSRDKNETSPANVVTSTIKSDIEGVKVASFPEKEFGDVDGLENNCDPNGEV